MGSDVLATSPDGKHTESYHFSKNRAMVLITYGFWIGDFHDKTVREVLVALNNVIITMMAANIKPIIPHMEWAYNEDAPGAMGNAIHVRNGLEANTGLDWRLWIDS